MGRERRRERGQGSVELLGVAVAIGFLALVGWQAMLAAYAWQTAQGAARIAARAGSVGAPVERAALAALPGRLATRANVMYARDRSGVVRVTVRVPIPRVLSGRGSFGAVDGVATAAR